MYTLKIQAETGTGLVSFDLMDEYDSHKGHQERALSDQDWMVWERVLTPRIFVMKRMNGGRSEAEAMAEVGAAAGELLGPQILATLDNIAGPETVVVRIEPSESAGASRRDRFQDLPAALANVPWEMAVSGGDSATLFQKNILFRISLETRFPSQPPIFTPPRGRPLRVLLCFPEPRSSPPLALRLERERLLEVFFRHVLPQPRNVEVVTLCNGLTRARIQDVVGEHGGFDIVHWSSHGSRNSLQIEDEKTLEAVSISGRDLVGLLRTAAVPFPRLFVLAACQSGAMGPVLPTGESGSRLTGEAEKLAPPERIISDARSESGTAAELALAGIPQVVAMRYQVADGYARRLGRRFYKRLLGDPNLPDVEWALQGARLELLDPGGRRYLDHTAMDHFTPVVFGAGPLQFQPDAELPAQIDGRFPRPDQQPEEMRYRFVGRHEELGIIHRDCLDRTATRRVVLVTGSRGIGKTSLVAEATHLWHYRRFTYVVVFRPDSQARIEDLYHHFDTALSREPAYQKRPAQKRVYLSRETYGEKDRVDAMRLNLMDVLRTYPTLLVLDDLTPALRLGELPSGGHQAIHPPWDALLGALATNLSGTSSRVLVTSRRRPAALLRAPLVVHLPLERLPADDVWRFFEHVPVLRALRYGAVEQRALLRRILAVVQGCPTDLQRVADAAESPAESESQIAIRLDEVEKSGGSCTRG